MTGSANCAARLKPTQMAAKMNRAATVANIIAKVYSIWVRRPSKAAYSATADRTRVTWLTTMGSTYRPI